MFYSFGILHFISFCRFKLSDDGEGKFCLSEECIKASNDVLSKEDSKIDPCQDFYHFACGGFEKTTVLPQFKTRYGQ